MKVTKTKIRFKTGFEQPKTGLPKKRVLTSLWKTPIELGGSDKEVQIDESLLVGAKYQQGCNLYRPQTWIFRDYGVVRKVGYVTYVKKRVVATLLPIIERVILRLLYRTSGERMQVFQNSWEIASISLLAIARIW